MNENKKILVITVPSWNSKVGANSWESLLKRYPAENVASIYIRNEIPDSPVCSRYFNISENKIIKSLYRWGMQTGVEVSSEVADPQQEADLQTHNARYARMKKKRPYSLLLARELIWKLGRWKTPELDAFLDSFQPDVILHAMDGYIHLNRIIQYAIKRTGAAAVGYIWDDNFTYKQSSDLGYKIYRFFQRRSVKALAKQTKEFFAISPLTKKESDEFFGINCHLLTKPLSAEPMVRAGQVGECINILYTGNLYIGRDQSLLKVVNAVKNKYKGRFFIDVYTNSQLEEDYLAQIDPTVCKIHDPIPQSEVLEKQRQADVLLFLEDIDGKDAKVARLSFSTKITDYLSAGKCIMAVGNIDTAPLQYFIENNAALACGSVAQIEEALTKISNSPELLTEMAEHAAKAGRENHNKEKIQSTFDKVIASI